MSSSLLKEVLRECRADLQHSLSPCGGLTGYLYGKRFLNDVDKQRIHAKETQFEQASEFLDRLKLKDDEALDEMIAYMKQDGSQLFLVKRLEEAKAEILRQAGGSESGGEAHTRSGSSSSASTRANDFILDYSDAPRITDVLVRDPTLLAGWGMIFHKFNLSAVASDQVEGQLGRGNKHAAILTTVREYISNRGTSAMYDALIEIFGTDYSNAADKLKEKKEEIRGSVKRS